VPSTIAVFRPLKDWGILSFDSLGAAPIVAGYDGASGLSRSSNIDHQSSRWTI
jgi:hypothetical protein